MSMCLESRATYSHFTQELHGNKRFRDELEFEQV
jgi:hypothetical protein